MKNEKKQIEGLTAGQFSRLAHNYYLSSGQQVTPDRIGSDSRLVNYLMQNQDKLTPKKVAFLWICTGPLYWQYAGEMIKGAREFFLPGHNVDYFLWSDIPKEEKDLIKLTDEWDENYKKALAEGTVKNGEFFDKAQSLQYHKELSEHLHSSCNVTFTEAVEWPLPTLMRYHLFLQKEEELKDYDYIFYCDVDMKFVNFVGDEILGPDLTAAPHPGYALRRNLIPPYEPNPDSMAYIPRPGRIKDVGGKVGFEPEYYAGGFQGGTSESFLKAMRVMKKNIDKDYTNNYTAIWNDESHWNKYLFENPPSVMLDCSYIYPDSLIKEYYEPFVWGRSFNPRLITITKQFTTTKEGGEAVAGLINK